VEALRRFVEDTLWPQLQQPVADILEHLALTLLSILSIRFIELVLYVARLDGKVIPGTQPVLQRLGFNTEVTLGDWLFVLEVIAATTIIMVGIYRAITGSRRS
jgi:hypothetical protein